MNFIVLAIKVLGYIEQIARLLKAIMIEVKQFAEAVS